MKQKSPEELAKMSENERGQYEATWLWRCTDAEIAEECTRYSYTYNANDPLMNKLAILFEANSRILANQYKILKAIKKLTNDKKAN
jgi:hypothetical protein